MKVGSLATVALLASEAHSFSIHTRARSSTILKAEIDSHAFVVYPKDKPVNGAAPPAPQYSAPVAQEASSLDSITEESKKNPLLVGGIVFIGLPIWLLCTNLFFGGGSSSLNPSSVPATAPAPIVVPAPAPVEPVAKMPMLGPGEIALPKSMKLSASDAKPAGIVVLSQPITKAEVRGLFNLWNNALKTLDPDVVAQRYSKEGVLLPTLSDRPRNDYEAIKDYFVHFLEKKPDGKILEGEIYVGNNWAQDAGIYEFTFEDGSKVKARYSFVYVWEDGKWMISHHHSSLMPEEVTRVQKITKDEVRALFGLWNDALATGDPQKVADRYTNDAVLLPTVSNEVRYTNDRVADYFVGFLRKKPTGEILEGNIKIGPNWAQDAGM